MKRYFLTRNLREKLLLVAFVAIGALWWLSAASRHLSAALNRGREDRAALAEQKVWLDDKARVDERASKAAGSLDAGKTYDATRLVAEVTAMASDAGLALNTDSPRTQRTAQFAFHTVQVTFRKADLASLIDFYRKLSEHAPYLGLEQFTVQADRSDPSQLNVSMQIASIELVK